VSGRGREDSRSDGSEKMNVKEYKEKSYELIITFKCNWYCDYCIVKTHDQNPKPLKEVLREIEEIPSSVESVTIGGGEPGILSEDDITLIINKLLERGFTIDLLTNGLFLEKYPHLMENIGETFYHCIEDISDPKSFKRYDYKELYYVVVLDKPEKENYILEILDDNEDIEFLILFNTRPGDVSGIKSFNRLIHRVKDKINFKKTKEEFLLDISKF